jgi:non-canonical (house-cleaning) NTP pyrophosphatase
MFTIYLSSDSAVKSEAVRLAFGRNNELINFSCRSLVHEQPYGFNESMRGLYNRHSELKLRVLES